MLFLRCSYQYHIIRKKGLQPNQLLIITCCHSLLLVVTRCATHCRSLSFVVLLVVAYCHLLYYSLSFVATHCTTRCHSMYHLSVTLHTKKSTNSEKCFAYQFLGKYSITSNPRKPIIDQKMFPEQEIGGISTLFTLGWLYSNHQMTYFRHLTDME